LGANSLLSCIFSGLFVAPGLRNLLESGDQRAAADRPESLYDTARRHHQQTHDQLLHRSGDGENPYLLHQQLGEVMTGAATVVRYNDRLDQAYEQVCQLEERAGRCSLSDTGGWSNQNVVYTKALLDMFPLAKTILRGARQRDECRGAHYKPDFALPGLDAEDPAERRHQAQRWCDRFEESNRQWLKSTIATWGSDGQPQLTYEEVDTSLIPPRPRLYDLVGAEVIEEEWKSRQQAQTT
jgi:succinate dehydrogenase / fumarate reductase flavoprotein subunit